MRQLGQESTPHVHKQPVIPHCRNCPRIAVCCSKQTFASATYQAVLPAISNTYCGIRYAISRFEAFNGTSEFSSYHDTLFALQDLDKHLVPDAPKDEALLQRTLMSLEFLEDGYTIGTMLPARIYQSRNSTSITVTQCLFCARTNSWYNVTFKTNQQDRTNIDWDNESTALRCTGK
eukprot:6106321-Amphidinium_carterae.1